MAESTTPPDVPLEATAQVLTFESGMYAVDFHAPRTLAIGLGLPLPCARLDAIQPGALMDGRAIVSVTAEGGWLSHGDLPAFVRVVGGKAGVLLTIYKSAGDMPFPELRVRYIRDDLQFEPIAPPADPLGDTVGSEESLPAQVLVHAQERGDVRVRAGEWAGVPGSRRLLEGFAVSFKPDIGIAPEELEYQGILGDKWNTPWFAAGEFCGSRGMALPILGLRARLTGRAAETHECRYWGSFVGLGEVGPFADGAACEGGGQPMDGLRLSIVARPAADTDRPA